MNDELERIWKEAVMAYFNVLSRHLSEGTEANHEKICPDVRTRGRDLKLEPPEYEAEVLNTLPQRSVTSFITPYKYIDQSRRQRFPCA
jgi:hypothetical protein